MGAISRPRPKSTRTQFLIAAALLLLLSVGCKRVPREHANEHLAADLILFGGKVYTANPNSPWAQAVAIKDDRIVSVGLSSEVTSLAGPQTLMIDLSDRLVIPGINDAHDHLGDASFGVRFTTDPTPTPNPELLAVVDSVRSLVHQHPAGTWLYTQVGMNVLGQAAAARRALDEAAPQHPVLLFAWWGHGAIINSRGLSELEIGEDTPDPLGGRYDRDLAGRLTGKLEEYAAWSVLRRLHSRVSEEAIAQHLRRYAENRLRYGVTTVQDMSGHLEPAVAARVFRRAALPIRVRVIRWPMPDARSLHRDEWAAVDETPAARTTVSGTKWVLDGTPIEQLAFRSTPYPHRGDWRGRLNFPTESIREIIAAAASGRDQLMLHVVGDATTDLVLTQMEAVADPAWWQAKRVRIEHAVGIIGPQIERARRLGIVIAQPRAGAPWRAWLDAGIPVAYGSDGDPNPFVTILEATTSPKAPPQAISREQAVTMMTRASAFAEFRESEKGMLAPRMFADLAVLSHDLFTIPAAALPQTKSVLTIVGGSVAFDAGVLAPRRGRVSASASK